MSSDGGGSFFGWREISDTVPGRKFMPWVCVTGKHLFASWFDRRPSNGVGTDNSLTDFYLGRMDFASFGPKVSANINMSVNADSQCSSGWPNGTRVASSATLCTIQPQAYGICTNGATPPVTAGNCQPGAVPGTSASISPAWREQRLAQVRRLQRRWLRGWIRVRRVEYGHGPAAGAPAGINVWVRPYQADSRVRPMINGAANSSPKNGGSWYRPDHS